MTRSLFPLLLVTLLGAGQAWAASDRDAKFQDVGQISDQGQLRNALPDPASLAPGSEVKIRGTMDGQPFELKVEKNVEGRTEVKLEGVTYQGNLEAFLKSLPNADEVKFEGVVNNQRVEAKLEHGSLKMETEGAGTETEGASGDRRHRGRDGTSKDLNNDEHAKDRGKDELNRHYGRDERAIDNREHVEHGEEQEDLARDRDRRGDRMEQMEHREGHERSEGADRHERAEHAERR